MKFFLSLVLLTSLSGAFASVTKNCIATISDANSIQTDQAKFKAQKSGEFKASLSGLSFEIFSDDEGAGAMAISRTSGRRLGEISGVDLRQSRWSVDVSDEVTATINCGKLNP